MKAKVMKMIKINLKGNKMGIKINKITIRIKLKTKIKTIVQTFNNNKISENYEAKIFYKSMTILTFILWQKLKSYIIIYILETLIIFNYNINK